MPLGLRHQQEIIDVHVSLSEGCRRLSSRELCVVGLPCPGNQNRGVCRWRRVGRGLQTVLREPSILAHALVGQVAGGFGEHDEVGVAFHSPHGKGKRKTMRGVPP
jgi:hypothetical protein